MTASLKDQIEAYIASGSTLYDALVVYVTDKSIPLQDRWETFLAAPSDWLTEQRVCGFPLDSMTQVFQSPYDDFHMDYGSEMAVKELFDDIENKLEFSSDQFEGLTQELIDAGKEEAMEMMLGRWEYNN
jgi:hypothetical protein